MTYSNPGWSYMRWYQLYLNVIKEEYNKKINTLKNHLLGFENIITVTIFYFFFGWNKNCWPRISSGYQHWSIYLEKTFLSCQTCVVSNCLPLNNNIRVITKLPNSEQSYKGKVETHNYINRHVLFKVI